LIFFGISPTIQKIGASLGGVKLGIERIDKTDHPEYWQVAASAETHKDKGQGQEESPSDHFEALGESTDWRLLFDKSKLWKKNIQVLKDELKRIIFRKINLKTDPSLLRVDIELASGEMISPAFVSISRLDAFKIKSLRSGDVIPEAFLLRDGVLHINIPTNPQLFDDEKKAPAKAEEKAKAKEISKSPSADQGIKAEAVKSPPVDAALEPTVKSPAPVSWLSVFKQPVTPEMLIVYGLTALSLFFLIIGIILLK